MVDITSNPERSSSKFTSVREGEYSDPWFYKCPRERIFIFHKYSPPTHYDVDHPRNISYRCMFGLDRSNDNNAYILSLTTAEGRSRDFYITLPVRWHESINWRPAVATYLNETQRTIQVIVEPQPRNFSSIGYQVTLCTQERGCGPTNPISVWDTNSTVFNDISHGVYFVKVVSKACAAAYKCLDAISFTIDATGIPKNAADLQPGQITIMVVGCAGGVVLVVVVFVTIYCVRRGRRPDKYDQKPQGIVIHPFLDVSRSNSSTDRKYVKLMEDFQTFIGKACECQLAPIPVDCLKSDKTALDRLFSGLKFAIVICADNNLNQYFETLLTTAMKKRTKENNLFVIPVTLSCFPSPTKPKRISDVDMITLLRNKDDLLTVYNKIHGSNLELIQPYDNTPEYKDLEKSIKDASPVSYFENLNTKIASEQGTKPICEQERNIKQYVDITPLNSTKCDIDDNQHKPCVQDIGENSPERKQLEVARIKTNLSRFNDSSSDVSYNGARPKQHSREVQVASERVHYGPDEFSRNQSHHFEYTQHDRASNIDSGRHSHQITTPQRHIMNEHERMHIKTYSVPHRSDVHKHLMRGQPTDYDNESTLLLQGQGSNIESNAPFVSYESPANFSPLFEHHGLIEKIPMLHAHDWSSRHNDISVHKTTCAIPRSEYMHNDSKYNQFDHNGTPIYYDHWNYDMQTRLFSTHSRDPYYGEHNIDPRSNMPQNPSQTCDAGPYKEKHSSTAATDAVAKTFIYFPAIDKISPFVTQTSTVSGKIRIPPKASSIPSDLNTISDWIPPETGSILVGSNDELMDKMNKINENYTA